MKKRFVILMCLLGSLSISITGCTGSSNIAIENTGESVNAEAEANADGASAKENEDTEKSADEDSSENAESESRDVFAMDTYMTVTAYGEYAEEAVDRAEEEILRLDSLLSTGDETSEVAQVNANNGGKLSEDAAYLVERSLELYEETDGRFDIAIYPVMEAWGFTDENYRVPDADELEDLLTYTDVSQIEFDETTGEIGFAMDGMQIDLGGIAKGYTSTRIMDIYRECGVTSGLVNLGGNVQVMGTKTDGSSWRVAVQNPDDENDYIGVLSIVDKAVITSGGYERYFEEDGKTYHHIIDPATGYPADNGLTSVTIVSADGTLADGLSTSLFIMGREDAVEFWQAHSEEFDMILMDEDGVLWVSDGIADDFESNGYEVQIVEADEKNN
jgi:thiamine biosynthesis lipoprotein